MLGLERGGYGQYAAISDTFEMQGSGRGIAHFIAANSPG
jgi:hypothetical protein